MPAISAALPAAPQLAELELADLPAVLQIEQQLQLTPWSERNFRDSLAAEHTLQIMRCDGVVAGYSVTMVVLDEAHLLNIGVAPPWQRRGLGAWLLGQVLSAARAQGARCVFLEVRASNLPALALYQRFGFQRIGQRKGYYALAPGVSEREDALVLQRTLAEVCA